MRISVQIEFDKILDLNTAKTTVVIGRASDVADIVVPHPSISRRHCKVEFIDNIFYITDLKSSNGVIIDGKKIPPMIKTRLPANATIKLAKLDCEISQELKETDASKIESHVENHDFTSTIRIARIDLEKEILETREVTKSPPRVKGPRNPITHRDSRETNKKKKSLSFIKLLLIIIFLLLSGLAIIFYRSM